MIRQSWCVWCEDKKWRCFSLHELASANHSASCLVASRPQGVEQAWAVEAPTRGKAVSIAKRDCRSRLLQ